MKTALKLVGRFVTTTMVLLGILYVPSDILGSVEALKPWQTIFADVDRFIALAYFCAVLCLWMLWVDIGPSLVAWWYGDKARFSAEEKRRELVFQETVKERIALSKQINQLANKGPLVFRTIEDLHAEFDQLNRDTDIFLGVGDLPFIVELMQGAFAGAHAAKTEGLKVALGKAEVAEVIRYFSTIANLCAIFANKWLQGEENSYEVLVALEKQWQKEAQKQKSLFSSLEKLAKHCNIDSNTPEGVIFRHLPWAK